MKWKKSLLLCIAVFFIQSGLSLQAAPPSYPKSIVGSSPQLIENGSPKPLRTTLELKQLKIPTPSLCQHITSIHAAIKQKDQQIYEIFESSNHVHSGLKWYPQSISGTLPYYGGAVQMCCSPEKSFSVQEQQEAACTGSDTVQACMDKLTRHCLHKAGQQLHIRSDMQDRKEKVQHKKDLFNNISLKIGEMEQLMQNLLSVLP